jgi:hypothetical protein
VPGRVQADGRVTNFLRLPPGKTLDDRAFADTLAQDRFPGKAAQVGPATVSRVIAVSVRDDGPRNGTPRIDVKPAH